MITKELNDLIAEHGNCRDALNVALTQLEAATKQVEYLKGELAKGEVVVDYNIFVNDSLWADRTFVYPEQAEQFWERHKLPCGCNINLFAEIRRVTETTVMEFVKELA